MTYPYIWRPPVVVPFIWLQGYSQMDTHIVSTVHKIKCIDTDEYLYTRSLGTLRAPTSSWRPFGHARLRPSRPSGAQAARPTQVTHLSPKKIWQFSGNLEVRWLEILLEALDKSIWPCLRNTVRKEVIRVFVTEDRGIGHFSSWIDEPKLLKPNTWQI